MQTRSAATAASERPQAAAGVLEGVTLDLDSTEGDGAAHAGSSAPGSTSSSSSSSSGGMMSRGFGRTGHAAGPEDGQQPSGVEEFMQAHGIKIEYAGSGRLPTPVLTMEQAPFSSSVMASVRVAKCRFEVG